MRSSFSKLKTSYGGEKSKRKRKERYYNTNSIYFLTLLIIIIVFVFTVLPLTTTITTQQVKLTPYRISILYDFYIFTLNENFR
jgi:hypothetical protein